MKVLRSSLFRQFCTSKPKNAVKSVLPAKDLIDALFDKTILYEDLAKEEFQSVRLSLSEHLKGEQSSSRVPGHKIVAVFNDLIEKNIFNQKGTEIILNLIVSALDKEQDDNMSGFYKGMMIDSETWFQNNLLTKLEVVLILLDNFPSGISQELVLNLDDSLTAAFLNKTEELDSFKAISATIMTIRANQSLKKNGKQELSKAVAALNNLKPVYQEKLDQALNGTNLEAMVTILELLQYSDTNLSNTSKVMIHLESYFKNEQSEPITRDMLIQVGHIEAAFLCSLKIQNR